MCLCVCLSVCQLVSALTTKRINISMAKTDYDVYAGGVSMLGRFYYTKRWMSRQVAINPSFGMTQTIDFEHFPNQNMHTHVTTTKILKDAVLRHIPHIGSQNRPPLFSLTKRCQSDPHDNESVTIWSPCKYSTILLVYMPVEQTLP